LSNIKRPGLRIYDRGDAHRYRGEGPPEAESLVRLMRQGAAQLGREFPELLACRLSAEPMTGGDRYEIHAELLFPGRQVILNRGGTLPKAALREVLAAASALAGANEQNRNLAVPHDVLGIAA
jgi:hypothetical protein